MARWKRPLPVTNDGSRSRPADRGARREETLVAPASVESLDRVHQALERFWRRAGASRRVPSAVQIALSTAVAEIVTNILRHARADSFGLTLRASGDTLEACLTDRGVPFREPVAGPVPELAEGGRGLLLARRSVSRLEYSRSADGENRWRLVVELGR